MMAKMASAKTVIATGVTSPNAMPILVSQDGIAGGTSSAARASTATTGKDRGPTRATMLIVRNTASTNPAACATGSSSTISAPSSPQRVQNRASGTKNACTKKSQPTAKA